MPARFTTLDQWLAWLETLHPKEIDLGLARIFKVAVSLNLYQSVDESVFSGRVQNANNSLPNVITVSGTNGKGSFVTTQEQLLHTAKKRVGSFTSPHLMRYNERIRIDSNEVSDKEICSAFEAIDSARADTSLSYFEFAALAAMWIFHNNNCEYWVLEVGLGGRLDAVNIVDCSLAVITSIGFDHEKWLGNTLDKIAIEKAGILRKERPVIFASPNMPNVLHKKAAALHCPVIAFSKDYSLNKTPSLNEPNEFVLNAPNFDNILITNPKLPIFSIAAAVMSTRYFAIEHSCEYLQKLCSNLTLAGRFEILEIRQHKFIFDVAHNPMAMERLANELIRYKVVKDIEQVECVVAMMADKAISSSLKHLKPVVDKWVCASLPDNPRAESAKNLLHNLLALGVPDNSISVSKSIEHAMMEIYDRLSSDTACHSNSPSLTLVCGSFFTVSAAKKIISNRGEH